MRKQLFIMAAAFLSTVSHSEAQDVASNNSMKSYSSSTYQCLKGRNDYFESTLQNLVATKDPKKRTLPVALLQLPELKNPHINPLCIQGALSEASGGPHSSNIFQICSGNKILTKDYEPCQSPNYLKMVHHSFELVVTCMKDFVSESTNAKLQNDWVETYFTLITKESGLQANIVSQNDALGPAQLTGTYRRDFLNESLDDVRQHLKQSKSAYCQSLEEYALSPQRQSGLTNKCNLLGVDSGPLTGLLIGFSHLKHYRDQIISVLYKNTKLTAQLSEAEKLNLERILVTISYNTGVKGLTDPLEYTLIQLQSQSIQNVEQFINLLVKNLQVRKGYKRVGKNLVTTWGKIPGGDRSNEIKGYLKNIQERYKKVMTRARALQMEQFPHDKPLQSCRMR